MRETTTWWCSVREVYIAMPTKRDYERVRYRREATRGDRILTKESATDTDRVKREITMGRRSKDRRESIPFSAPDNPERRAGRDGERKEGKSKSPIRRPAPFYGGHKTYPTVPWRHIVRCTGAAQERETANQTSAWDSAETGMERAAHGDEGRGHKVDSAKRWWL